MSEDKLDKIENKIDKITEHIANIDVTLAKQSVSLDVHIKRTNQLEDRQDQLTQCLTMISSHLAEFKGVVKFIKILGVIAGIAEVVHIFWK